jgi:hypothetical protein
MTGVTVKFMATDPPKVIHKEFKSRKAAYNFIVKLDGENFIASLDDGTLALYVGWSVVPNTRVT